MHQNSLKDMHTDKRMPHGMIRATGLVGQVSRTPLKCFWVDCRADSSETSPRSAAEAGEGVPSAEQISSADPPGGSGSSLMASQASGPANAAAAKAHVRAQRGQTGKSSRIAYMYSCITEDAAPLALRPFKLLLLPSSILDAVMPSA